MARKALIKNLGNIDIRLLRIFMVVTECGGFAASEFELNIGRSTISKHISDLETRLGMKLCNRGPAGFSLTAEGRRVLDVGEGLLNALNKFQNDVDEIHQNLTGTLRFAFFGQPAANPNANIQAAIQEFNVQAIEVILDISIEPPTVIEAGIIEGKFDVGIVPLHRISAALDYHKLYTENMTLYCGKDHFLYSGDSAIKCTKKDLQHYKYAGLGFNSPNMFVGQKMNFRRSARVQDEEALLVLIKSGKYLGFLPDHMAEPFVKSKQIKPVQQSKTRYISTFAVIVRKTPEPSRIIRTFLNCLKSAHE